MLQYKIIRTRYALSEYAQNTIEERLNEAVKDDWKVEQMASANIGTNVVETYLLSRNFFSDEEREKMYEQFRAQGGLLYGIGDQHVKTAAEMYVGVNLAEEEERSQAMAENFKWVYGSETAKRPG